MSAILNRIAVFELGSTSSAFCSFAFADDEDDKWFRLFDGRSHAEQWTAVGITAADEPDATAELGDFAFLGTIPVLSARAVGALSSMLEKRAELLKLRYPRGEYYALNVLRTVDALDEGSSELERFHSGRVMAVNRFAFKAERLQDEVIFRIPQLQRGHVFVTKRFVDSVRQHELMGFSFKQVWSNSDTRSA